MKNYKLSIETVITKLGYGNSKNLIYYNDFESCAYTTHISKIVFEIKPYAIYFLDGKPFIFFFDSFLDERSFKTISKKVWNAQIPITIFCDEQYVKIYNGMALDLSNYVLEQTTEFSIDNCSMSTEFSYLEITKPTFWIKYSKEYSTDKLNHFLLDNITYLTDKLKNTYHISFATKLVLRLIFIRFLIDRGVDLAYGNFSSNIKKAQNELLDCIRNKKAIYDLFAYLKSKFNGNLFDLDNEIDCPQLTQDVFNLLSDFLSGTVDMDSGQISLFAMYDFNIIPVELISNIYEILLGREIREKDNAFYTPNYLVEYILDKTTLGFLKTNSKYTILDPACGSGVFLVDSYRRMVEENLQGQMYCEDDNLLKTLLTNNIFGIDINEEAIDVTIFSLYLTVLDYKDPKSLLTFNLPNLKGTNLFISDFFADEQLAELKNVSFDFIIGNPPWGNVKTGLHLKYCKDNGYKDKQQNNEICRSFVFRAKDFCSTHTVCCFILHSKLLYNQKKPSRLFRSFLLEKTKIHSIIELSSVRKLVFENADAPAAIISFEYSEGDNLKNSFTYTSIKPNIFFKLFNVILIEKNDIKYILQSMLYQNDWAWKTIVYGLSGDIDTILQVKKKYKSISQSLKLKQKNSSFICGSGIQSHLGDAQDASHLMGLTLLDSDKGIDHFSIYVNEQSKFDKPQIHRVRNQNLFSPPYCITAKGIDCSNYKMRSAFSDERFVCKETMYVIKGENEDKSTLLNLTGLLNSSFYAYLNLMLGTSLGIEREQRFMKEVLEYPYVYDQSIVKKAESIYNKKNKGHLVPFEDIDSDITNLDSLVLQAYKLKNNKFIDYAINIQIPELTNTNFVDNYRTVTNEELLLYSECYNKQFTTIYKRVGKHVNIRLYKNILNKFCVFELSVLDGVSDCKIELVENITEDKELLTKFCVFSHNDKFYQQKDVIHFCDSSFFIIKPNFFKYWHPAIAELDLSDIIDQIMNDSGGEE